MKNKIDFASAEAAAEKIKLRLDEEKFRSFPDVADFCAVDKAASDGELRVKNDIVISLDVTRIVRVDESDDASCFDVARCKGNDFGGKGV